VQRQHKAAGRAASSKTTGRLRQMSHFLGGWVSPRRASDGDIRDVALRAEWRSQNLHAGLASAMGGRSWSRCAS
jgi:hypothetical protein